MNSIYVCTICIFVNILFCNVYLFVNKESNYYYYRETSTVAATNTYSCKNCLSETTAPGYVSASEI